MADPAHKKRVRGGHRTSATKMIRKVEELLAPETKDYRQLAKTRLSLQEMVSVLKRLDAEVVDLVAEDEVADEIDKADTYMEDVYDVMAKLEELFQKKDARPASADATHSPVTRGTTSAGDTKVKLPKLMIKPFEGELTAWTTFWDSYQVAVHANRSLSDIEKFNYLRSLLQGPALEAIAGLTLTAANYTEAVEVLQKRFGNKQQIINKHMEILLNIEGVTSGRNLKALRHLYDTIEAQIRGLNSMGVTADSYGGLLSSVLLSKIPQDIHLIVSRMIGDGDRKLDDLMKMLLDELQARERSAASDITLGKGRENLPSTASALLAGGSGVTHTCYYCQQAHVSHACKNVTSVEEKKSLLREAGRCFVCLRRGHIGRQCTSKGRCPHCHGRHHCSICSNPEPTSKDHEPKDTGKSESTTANLATNMNPAATPFQPSTSTALWTNSNRTVLLQTAQAIVFNLANPRKSRRVRIVFDCGSQRSYVTDHVARSLSLVPEGEQSLSIMTFGSTKEQTQVCSVVRLGLTSKDKVTIPLTLFAVPLICEPVTSRPISFCQNDFDHLVGIDLAESPDSCANLEIDVLIGSDQYWELVSGGI